MKKVFLIFAIIGIMMACQTESVENYPPEHYNVEARKQAMLDRFNSKEEGVSEKSLCAGINDLGGGLYASYEVIHCCDGCGQWLIAEMNPDGSYHETYVGFYEDAVQACDIMQK